MSDAWIIGVSTSRFGKHVDRTFRELTAEVVEGVLKDAGLDDGQQLDGVWFGNCGMGSFGQQNIRGQVCLTPLSQNGVLPEQISVVNVEGACATGSLALGGAYRDVRSGEAELALALGVEKTIILTDPLATVRLFDGGVDRLHPEDWTQYFTEIGEETGHPLVTREDRVLFLDTYAMQARWHMAKYGTTVEQFAAVATKNHNNGSLNPNAHYRFETTDEAVLADRAVAGPLTRAMCCPVSDGAAAALVCSETYLKTLPVPVQKRAIRIAANSLSGGRMRRLDDPGLTQLAAKRAYARAGISPSDVQVAEVHDSTALCEIYQLEMLGLCDEGEGKTLAVEGVTDRDGRLPVNTSGGLISRGHPLAATGLGQTHEIVTQLRGEAGERQAGSPSIGLVQNAGGLIGLDEAICAVTVLSRT